MNEDFFLTRGLVLSVDDLPTLDWPERMKRAGLTTLGTHVYPHQVVEFVRSEAGQSFLQSCAANGIWVEHELHAMSDLLPRELYHSSPAMFPMNDEGERIRDYNLCIHSADALEIVCEQATEYTRLLPSDTGRYFYWADDGRPMCRCPLCRDLSDSDQTLILENAILKAIRRVDPRATLSHLAYLTTLPPPTQVKPEPGIFLEFAPIKRRYDLPLCSTEGGGSEALDHEEQLDALDANLEWFGAEGAQALEYWLDVSRFAGWDRANISAIPWDREVFLNDMETYAHRGVRHVTTFAVWMDADYMERFGDRPLREYGENLLSGTKNLNE